MSEECVVSQGVFHRPRKALSYEEVITSKLKGFHLFTIQRKSPVRGLLANPVDNYAPVVVDEDVVDDDVVVDVEVVVVEEDDVEDVDEDEDEVVVVDVVVVDVLDDEDVVDEDVVVVDDELVVDVVVDELVVVDVVVDDEVVVEVELDVVVKLKFDFCKFENRNSAICFKRIQLLYISLHLTTHRFARLSSRLLHPH